MSASRPLAAGGLLLLGLAAAPPPADPPEVAPPVARAGGDGPARRPRRLEELEGPGGGAPPGPPRLRRYPDVDVRLRALVVARAIRARGWGLIKAMGPGASLTAPPFGGGYWLNRVAFSGDGQYAVVGGGALILYDLATGKEVR